MASYPEATRPPERGCARAARRSFPARGATGARCYDRVLGSPLSPSSRGLGRGPFKAKTRVRIPLGTYPFSVCKGSLLLGTASIGLAE